jgi:co-chaperonin GroES (HSP10)
MKTDNLNIELLLDNIVLEPIKIEDKKTAGGFFISAQLQERNVNTPRFGIVKHVGPGAINPDGSRREMTVKAGDKVCYQFYSGRPFEFEGKTMLLMREPDVNFIIKS